MSLRADVVIIGAGVTGCAIAFELVRRGVDGVVLVEREPDVGEGASRANSGIVHTGFDATAGSIEARLLRRAADLWPDLVELLDVPFLPVGALMLARSTDDMAHLREVVMPGATSLGVDVELLDAPEIRQIAPYATDRVLGALSIPGESVIDPFWLTRAYAEAAMAGGATVLRGVGVTGLGISDDHVRVELDDGRSIHASQAVDAAGIRADEVARLAGDESFLITPRRGQFLVSEETFGVDRIILPVPGPMGKGMLVTPIVFGGLLLGPTARDIQDKTDRGIRPDETHAILESVAALVPSVAKAVPVRSFVGLRTVSSTGDLILRPSVAGDRLWLACGIRSTGVSVSPAVAEHVADAIIRARGWGRTPRHVAPPPTEFAEEAGPVVCLCRGVSRGELVAACRRPLAPHTLDAIKRRGGAMFGDCQGNLCTVSVAGVLADELGIAVTDVQKGPSGSWVLARAEGVEGKPAPAAPGAPSTAAGPGLPADSVDVVIVGLGHAGTSAAEVAQAAGLRVVAVDRRGGRTAIGLVPRADGWEVETQGADGTASVRTRAVLVATGGYVTPREQREVAGPRPAGVVTSDLVEMALAAGLVPGHRAAIVGEDALATRTIDALVASGVSIAARLTQDPLEVRGAARLEAVRSDSGWHDADTLVFADRLTPQPFLLRGLGLVDGRPGTPAPADREGRVGPPGLWAAGCCVVADADHAGCDSEGRRVGEAIVRTLGGRDT